MPAAPSFQAEVRQLLHTRILDAAHALVCAEGWQAVNMSRIATTVGISRQVLYKEIGAKQALGEALVQRETSRFITGVITAIQSHPGDVAGLPPWRVGPSRSPQPPISRPNLTSNPPMPRRLSPQPPRRSRQPHRIPGPAPTPKRQRRGPRRPTSRPRRDRSRPRRPHMPSRHRPSPNRTPW